MPYMLEISIVIPVCVGFLALFVIANFGLATFMDPGVYPKGKLALIITYIIV